MAAYIHDEVVPFKDSALDKKGQVEEMFNRIAFRYDFLNRLLSGGIDVWWRRQAINMLKPLKPQIILDVATGTGDVAIMMQKMLKPQQITGIDISEGMLTIGRKKVAKLGLKEIELVKADSEALGFSSGTFDAATVAFGVRNFENLEKGLGEIRSVLKDGGMLVVLEFSKPTNLLVVPFCKLYMNVVMPLLGRLFSKDKTAYSYLNESVNKFPEGEGFLRILEKAGYKNVSLKKLTFGVCSIYCGIK